MTSLITRITKHKIFQNLVGLYAIRMASMVIPLLTLPILARNLSKAEFGTILYAQYFAGLLSIIVDYGLSYTATRLVSRSAGDEVELRRSVATVQGAKSFLFAVFCIVSGIAYLYSGNFREHPVIICLFLGQMALQQLSPMWFFQGIEEVNSFAGVELCGRILLLVLTFFMIRTEGDGVLYALISLLTSSIVSLVTNFRMYKNVNVSLPRIGETIAFLKDSSPLFLMRLGSAFYMAYTPVYVGNHLTASAVASYGGSERIFRAAAALLTPISDAIFPRINALEEQGNKEAYDKWLRISLFILILVSCLAVAALYLLAPVFVKLLLGEQYMESVKFIRILVASIPAIALGSYAGVQVLLSKKKDAVFTAIVISGGFLNLALLNILVPRYLSEGAAYSVVITEWFVCLACLMSIVILKKRGEL